MKILSESEWLSKLLQRKDAGRQYLAMYSSWIDGIVLSPSLMMIPLDEHLVHRGDGVFEALRLVKGQFYLSQEHLSRLLHSAELIGLKSRFTQIEIQNLIQETVAAAKVSDGMIRVFLSRGAGDFSTNPYSTLGAELYIVVTPYAPFPEQKYLEGVSIGKSSIPFKPGIFSQIKSCNYLPNVMMKKESIDRGFDFVIGVGTQGEILESSTENILHIDSDGYLIRPKLHHILKGCTMMRVCELAKDVEGIKGVLEEDRAFNDLFDAQEIMMVGTTIDVLPVTSVEEELVGHQGEVGPIAKELRRRLIIDQTSS